MSDPVSAVPAAPAPAAPPTLPSDAPPAGESTLLAGKYKTVEELVKGYKNLESKLGAPPPAPAAPAPAGTPAPAGVVPPIDAAAAVKQAGLDFEALNAEYAANQTITDESYAKLEKAGIKRDIVDAYIEGQKALTERTQQGIYSTIGGEENYKGMIQWAAQNLDEGAKAAFNASVAGTVEQAKLAVAGLYSQFVAAEGAPPSLVKGTATGGSVGYESNAQFIADINDPRYRTDPAYRAAVAAKRSKSPVTLK